MVQTRLHKHSLSKAEQAVSNVASRASVRDPIDEFQEVYGSRAASAAFRQQLGSDFSQSGQFQPPIQAKPSFRGLSHELAAESQSVQLREDENKTGLPDDLKAGVEALSGFSMDDVRVHYNSSKPAQLQALAYTQGTEIHVAPGQEEHLPHEAWHVVQQAQGRVQPTMQMKAGVAVNDDQSLEHEADVMGTKALINTTTDNKESNSQVEVFSFNAPIQMVQPASKAEALIIAGTDISNKKGKQLPAGMRFKGKHGGIELKQQLKLEGEKVPDDLTFEECDVNTKIAEEHRDAERLILGSDGRVWYTDKHYKVGSFVELTD